MQGYAEQALSARERKTCYFKRHPMLTFVNHSPDMQPTPCYKIRNPNKLLGSKWTAAQPMQKRKHFIITKLLRDEQQLVISCVLEAVIDNHQRVLPWRDLNNHAIWLPGWQTQGNVASSPPDLQ
jgi:tryptophan-rich hypothetical protein